MLNHNIADVNLYAQRLFPESYQKCRNFLTENPLAVATWNKKFIPFKCQSDDLFGIYQIALLAYQKNVAFLFEGSYILCQYLKANRCITCIAQKTFSFLIQMNCHLII